MSFISVIPSPKLRWRQARGIPPAAAPLFRARSFLFREFVALLRKRPELALRMIGSMSRHSRNVVGLPDDLTLKNAEARCLNWLLRHCPTPRSRHPCEIELESPKRIVAAELNITSETLSRMLRRFRDKQLIRTTPKGILVLDPQRTELTMHQLLGEAVELVAK
jgi:CRP/FNR family transcriptional regulator, dissimilatory nitrate respiration regulator